MNEEEVIRKLNSLDNFHLSFKVVRFSDDTMLIKYSNHLNTKHVIADNIEESFDKLLKAYNDNIKIVLCNKDIRFLLPLVNVINTDNSELVRNMIPTYCYLKDNKIIQHIKTACNIKLSKITMFKDTDLLFETIDKIID